MAYLCSIAGWVMRYPAKAPLWRFIRKHLTITEEMQADSLTELSEQYDLFIVGSDCVWNSDAFELETAYLLDFVEDPQKKANFASSFAANGVPQELQPVYRRYLSAFPKLSVREQRGKELIQELTGRDATVVLDPTLTCDRSFWKDIIQESKLNLPGKFIFVAEYAMSPALIADARKLSEQYHLPIVCLYPPKGGFLPGKVFYRASPQDVLWLIDHAEYVLTDSYHMMIFSINFQKQFFAYRTVTNLPAISKYDSILQMLHLEHRLFPTEKDKRNAVDICSLPPVDYAQVVPALEEQRRISKEYLSNVLEERYAALNAAAD